MHGDCVQGPGGRTVNESQPLLLEIYRWGTHKNTQKVLSREIGEGKQGALWAGRKATGPMSEPGGLQLMLLPDSQASSGFRHSQDKHSPKGDPCWPCLSPFLCSSHNCLLVAACNPGPPSGPLFSPVPCRRLFPRHLHA